MKKLLLIFIFAIGIVTNASATKDTIVFTSTGCILPAGRLHDGSGVNQRIYLPLNDTLIIKTIISDTVDFTVSNISYNGLLQNDFFEYVITPFDTAAFTISLYYLSYPGEGVTMLTGTTVSLTVIVSASRYNLTFPGNGSTLNGPSFAQGIDTIMVYVGDTITFINGFTTFSPLNFQVGSTLVSNVAASASFNKKIIPADYPSFNVSATYVPFSITRQVTFVKVLNAPAIGLKENKTDFSINIFPNPAINKLSLSSLTNLGKITISNLIGQVVYSATSNNKQTTIDVSALPQGAYIVNVGGVYKKIIKD